MRKVLLTSTAVVFLLTGSIAISGNFSPDEAQAQSIKIMTNDKDPVTGLDAADWLSMMKREINGAPVVGQPYVFMLNATPNPLTVMCQTWQLVGPKPYISGAPSSLPPFTATVVPTNGFDGYCKDEAGNAQVMAESSTGDVYKGAVVSSDGTFTNAIFISFSPVNKQQ
jgi:hypothetical protein